MSDSGGGPVLPHCRTAQINRLRLYLTGVPAAAAPPLLFTYGLAATGKTLVTKYVLESEKIAHAVVHCVELYNISLMFESIVKQLTGERIKCTNIPEFISALNKALKSDQVYAILFEESERLRDGSQHTIQALTRLQELTGLNIVCIFESRIGWSRFVPSQGLPCPIIVHFPQYKKPELTKLIVAELPGDKSLQFKEDYVGIVLSVSRIVARSLKDLSRLARLQYAEYCKPVDQGEIEPHDLKKLFFHIEKPMTASLSTVHLREVATTQTKEKPKEKENSDQDLPAPVMPVAKSSLGKPNVSRINVELPYYSKFLLVAAYLASYNPATTDKRFFTKHHGKQRKTAKSIKAKEKYNSQLDGPKYFPLERMLAIFYNIIEEKVNPTANIFSQISSLAKLQLISGNDKVDMPKYKCTVNFEFIKTLSKNIKFDIQSYLY